MRDFGPGAGFVPNGRVQRRVPRLGVLQMRFSDMSQDRAVRGRPDVRRVRHVQPERRRVRRPDAGPRTGTG